MNRQIVWLVIIGILVGGLIGFMQRPSAFLLGQLPFSVVVSRGEGLQGLDQLLIPVAQKSFNVMATGGLVGGLLGGVIGAVILPPGAAKRRKFTLLRGGDHDA